MKKLIFAALMLLGMGLYAQNPPTYQKEGKTFIKIEETQSKKKSAYEPTNMWVEMGGKEYQVYSHVFTKGEKQGQTGYFIQMTSKKSGKTYWKEIKVQK